MAVKQEVDKKAAEYKPVALNQAVDTGYTQAYNDALNNKHVHKSFDLSNLSMQPVTDPDNKALRQFHQLRIFVKDFNNMRCHGELDKDKAATYMLTANLPESVQYTIGSNWSRPFSSFTSDLGNVLFQTIGRSTVGIDSGINRVNSLMFWNGSMPLEMNLKIPVIDDGYIYDQNATGIQTNFQEALEFLGSLILPSGTGALGFYTPPPSPLKAAITYNDDGKKHDLVSVSAEHAQITIALGGMLLLNDCVIKKVTVDYPKTKTMIRHSYRVLNPNERPGQSGSDYLLPLLAEISINIETVQAMTSQAYSNMLWLKDDKAAEFTAQIPDSVTKYVEETWNNIKDNPGAGIEKLTNDAEKAVENGAKSLFDKAKDTVTGWFS